MNWNIITLQPIWYLLLCIAVGIIVSYFTYFRKKQEFARRWKYILGGIRFLLFTLIAFLLLVPLVKNKYTYKEKPIIIFAQDNSSSIKMFSDTSKLSSSYVPDVKKLLVDLNEKYQVEKYSFSDKLEQGVDFKFEGKETNFALLREEIKNRYQNRNLGSIIIASDGLYNKGVSPEYVFSDVNIPIYTIPLGDTSIRKDISISNIKYNKRASKGNKTPIIVSVSAQKMQGHTVPVTIKEDSTIIDTKTITVNTDNYFTKLKFFIKPESNGNHHYTVEVPDYKDEVTSQNNKQDIWINVNQQKKKVLLLSSFSHPDISAIKGSVEKNNNFELIQKDISKTSLDFKPYSLIILYQIPNTQINSKEIIQKIKDTKVPSLHILGSQFNSIAFNQLDLGVQVRNYTNQLENSLPFSNSSFSLFTLEENTIKQLEDFPPLTTPFADIESSTELQTLVGQKLGSIKTSRPLIFFNNQSNIKHGFILGEGLWRWKISNYFNDNNHNAFDDIIYRMLQYLSSDDDKNKLQIHINESYNDNDDIIITAELYNDLHEQLNSEDINITITNQNNKKFTFLLSPINGIYHLNIGAFPSGSYKWMAQTKLGNELIEEKGEFIISPIIIEQLQSTANINTLEQLANSHGGTLVWSEDLNQIPSIIEKNINIKTIEHSSYSYVNIIDTPIYLIILLLLLILEWGIRRYIGQQ
ncbi:MAG: hypothetical protein ACEPOV_05875 [Hyphomicrobiales bacterium]